MPTHNPQTWSPPIAVQQAGAFTTAQAISAGLTRRQVSYRLKAGIFQRFVGKALRHEQTQVSPHMLAFGAFLTWPDTVIAGPTVAQLAGAPINTRSAHVIGHLRRRPLLNLIPHQFEIAPWDKDSWNGLRTTTPVRGILDSLVVLPPREAQSVFVWSFTHERLTKADLESHLELAPGRWGNARIRQFLLDAEQGVMSRAEQKAQEILKSAGLRGWKADAKVYDSNGLIARVDILFSEEQVIVEIDGRKYHSGDRFQADRTRDNRLQNAGYIILRFTWQDITQRPNLVISQVRHALTRRIVRESTNR